MTSIRVPPDLLAALHAATPEGRNLRQTLQLLLDKAGGPAQVRAEQEAHDRRARARANGRRLRARGASAVTLDEGFQESQARAAKKLVAVHDQAGTRDWQPLSRQLHLTRGPREVDAPVQDRIRIQRVRR